jgi:hypothetical protein
MKRAITALQAIPAVPPAERAAFGPDGELTSHQWEAAKTRIREALADGKFLWRSIERLAKIAGITEAQAMEILRGDTQVVLSTGKSGRPIARLAARSS